MEHYLYENEDFVILNINRLARLRVKLGDLFIIIAPGDERYYSRINVIDFEKCELKPAFSVDLRYNEQIPFEAFIPIELCGFYKPDYEADSLHCWYPSTDNARSIQEGYTLRKHIIERVFTSEQINRNRKKNVFFPIFEQHERQGTSQLGALPVELLDIVCAYVHANTFKQRKKSSSPLTEISELHGLFFAEINNQDQTQCHEAASNHSEKGKEKEASNKENRQPKLSKLAAPKEQGLFSRTQQKMTKPVEHAESNRNISNPGPRMFSGEQPVKDETQNMWNCLIS